MDKFDFARLEHSLLTVMMECRDKLQPIIDGEIERSYYIEGYSPKYGKVFDNNGKRKLKIKDAQLIAKTIQFLLNRAVNEYHERDKRPSFTVNDGHSETTTRRAEPPGESDADGGSESSGLA